MVQTDSSSGQYISGKGRAGTCAVCMHVPQTLVLRLILATALLLQIACAREQSASSGLRSAAIDRFFIPLLENGLSAGLPADPLTPPAVTSSVATQISDKPIVIRRAIPPPQHELRNQYYVEVTLWPGTALDGGDADLWVGGPEEVKTALDTPWVTTPDLPDQLPLSHLAIETNDVDHSFLFGTQISYPLDRAFTLPARQISSITMLCAACMKNADVSRLTGTGHLYLKFDGLLSGGIDSLLLTDADGSGPNSTVSGSLLFADADAKAAVAMSHDVTFNLDFGDGGVGFDGSLAIWQPATNAAAGVVIGSADDAFAGLGGVVLYFGPQWQDASHAPSGLYMDYPE